jgi:hypothetical protein
VFTLEEKELLAYGLAVWVNLIIIGFALLDLHWNRPYRGPKELFY